MQKASSNFQLIDPSKFPFFYGWMIILFGGIGVLMSAPGQTIGVSAFTDSLLDALKLSRDELSFAYMVGTSTSAIMLTRAGKFFDKHGAVKTGIFASVGLGISLLYLSQIDKLTRAIGTSAFIAIIGVYLGFIFIRFFGQGVLTLTSRTMVVKWFDQRRGLAIGILSMVTAYGFSIAPVIFDNLINNGSWSIAWIKIALVVGIIFPVIVFLFFKEAPEAYGQSPDGQPNLESTKAKKPKFKIYKDFTLQEARKTLGLWVYALLPAMFGLVVTAFSFHVVSIFLEAGFTRDDAMHIFQPIAIVAIVATLVFSVLSDYIKLKYIAVIFAICCTVTMYGISDLNISGTKYWILIIAYGCSSGIHPLILTVFLPRFFGKTYLGAITGQAMTVVVFFSALGPMLFSLSLSQFGSYKPAALICAGIFLILLVSALFTSNPQNKYAKQGIVK